MPWQLAVGGVVSFSDISLAHVVSTNCSLQWVPAVIRCFIFFSFFSKIFSLELFFVSIYVL
jgi:hypothetical protein